MLSLIEVTCPHCGAQGQIIMPPLDSVIIGPCPECQETVMVFCGKALPLDKEIVQNASFDEKKQHILEAIYRFASERVDRLLHDIAEDEFTPEPMPEALQAVEEPELRQPQAQLPATAALRTPISPQEVDFFVNQELRRLDSKDYFKSVFGE